MAYTLPDGFPLEAKDLVSKLILYEASQRLGVAEQGGFNKLKDHIFFKSINWTNLHEQDAPIMTVNVR